MPQGKAASEGDLGMVLWGVSVHSMPRRNFGPAFFCSFAPQQCSHRQWNLGGFAHERGTEEGTESLRDHFKVVSGGMEDYGNPLSSPRNRSSADDVAIKRRAEAGGG